MDISVILPVVNESDNLRVLIPRLHESLKREKLSYEIIVVASPPRAAELAPASTAA